MAAFIPASEKRRPHQCLSLPAARAAFCVFLKKKNNVYDDDRIFFFFTFQSLSRHSSDAHVTGAESGGLIDEEVKTVAMEFPFKTEGSAFAPCTALTMMMMSFGMVLATT